MQLLIDESFAEKGIPANDSGRLLDQIVGKWIWGLSKEHRKAQAESTISLLSDDLQEKFQRGILDCYAAHRNYKALLLNNVMSLQTQYKDEAIPFDDVVAVTSENHRAPQNLLRTALLKLILEEYVIPVERKMEYQRVSCIKVDWDAVSKDGLLLLE